MEHECNMSEKPSWLRLTRAYPTGQSGRHLEGNAGTVAR